VAAEARIGVFALDDVLERIAAEGAANGRIRRR